MELDFRGRRYPVPAGELIIGTDAGAGLQLEAGPPRHASVRPLGDKMATIRVLEPGPEILVNGVAVGAEPAPLLHGDVIRINGQEITVVNPGHPVGTEQTPPAGARERLHDTLFGMPRQAGLPSQVAPAATPPPPAPVRRSPVWIIVAAAVSLLLIAYLLLR